MFNEEQIRELKEDGLTDEQIEMFADALALKDTINMLPDNIEPMIRAYEQRVPEDAIQGLRATCELAQREPEFFRQLIALDIALASQAEIPAAAPAEKTIITNLSDKEYETASKNFFGTLASLSETDRKEFLKLIANITSEQKEDMVSRLIRQ